MAAGPSRSYLPSFDVESPWWRQVDDVVEAARRTFGLDLRVLRLLSSVGPMFPGGRTGEAWLKVVPPFFAHEGSLLPMLDPGTVPPVLRAEPGRVLLDGVPGADQYEATGDLLVDMVRKLVHLQAGWIGRTDELRELGVPDIEPAERSYHEGDPLGALRDAVPT